VEIGLKALADVHDTTSERRAASCRVHVDLTVNSLKVFGPVLAQGPVNR